MLSRFGCVDLLEKKIFLSLRLCSQELREQKFSMSTFNFWYVWDKADQLSFRDEEEAEAPSVIIDDRPRKQKYLTINDWLNNADQVSEEQEAAGYSPFEVVTERDFSVSLRKI